MSACAFMTDWDDLFDRAATLTSAAFHDLDQRLGCNPASATVRSISPASLPRRQRLVKRGQRVRLSSGQARLRPFKFSFQSCLELAGQLLDSAQAPQRLGADAAVAGGRPASAPSGSGTP